MMSYSTDSRVISRRWGLDMFFRKESMPQAYPEIFETIQAVVELATDGTVISANQQFLGTMGYALDEIRGHHHRIFVDPTLAITADYENFWQTLRQGEPTIAKYRRVGKDGREVLIEACYNPMTDKKGRIIKIIEYSTATPA